ncbi:MAG: DUF4159 domain-containing protein [Luteolibacter sp.]
MITRLAVAALWSMAFISPVSGQRPERNPRGLPADRHGVAKWENDPRFPDDTFRFVRLKPQNHYKWATDFPDSDLNFSLRLQQMTAIRVHPEPLIVSILDPKMKEHPFLYTIETGSLDLMDEEVKHLREHLLNGGFLMIDDFWGADEWENTRQQMVKLFPDRPITELELDHPIFNIVFQLKEKPQVPGIGHAMSGRSTGIFYEKGGKGAHYYGIFDAKGRMMVVICRNTDLGDGWEREGEDPFYFSEFSEKRAYPMGINIVVYSMTH